MKFEFKPSFDRSVKSLHGREKDEVKQIVMQTIDILSQDRIIYKGIGLKRLKGDYWEIRKNQPRFIAKLKKQKINKALP